MKLTLAEIEEVISELASATVRAKEARRVAKKVYGDSREMSAQLKYAYEHVQRVAALLEMRSDS